MLTTDPIENGFSYWFLGDKGLLSAFLAAFVTVANYRICVKNNVTIRMPQPSSTKYLWESLKMWFHLHSLLFPYMLLIY